MSGLHIDVETHSVVDLKKGGMYRYFEDQSTDVWCAAWAINDDPIQLWKKGEECPAPVRRHIEGGGVVVAHNAGFERQCFQRKLGPLYGFPIPELEQFECTSARAAAMALPRDLDGLAVALGLDIRKDSQGKRVMMQLARPRINANGELAWWDTHPSGKEKLETLYGYCKNDTAVERAAEPRLRSLSDRERQVWLLDQRLNERGVPVDIRSVQHARWVLYYHASRLDARLAELTQGAVLRGTQTARIVEWIQRQGVDIEKLDKAAVKKAIADLEGFEADEYIAGPDDYEEAIAEGGGAPIRAVREVLAIRQELSKSSTKKLDAFEERTSADGRARDNLRYAAASTLRWGGRGIQLQNLPRQQTKKLTLPDGRKIQKTLFTKDDIAWAFDNLPKRDPALFEQTIGPPALVVSDMLKGFIRAPAGRRFVKGDLSNIEGRVIAWLADEQAKLRAFREADAKTGPDIYLRTAAGIFGVPISMLNKDSPERQVGKVAELACGFGGSVGAFQTMAGVYDVTVSNDQAREIVYAWREAHPAIVDFWHRLEEAALWTVRNTGKATIGKCAFAYKSGIMWARKPNGEFLAYVDPQIRLTRRIIFEDGSALSQVASPNGVFKEPVEKNNPGVFREYDIQVPEHDSVTVMSVNSQTRRYERVGLYGGLLAENFTQAVARDVMVDAMFRVEAAGYPLILTVHDELISEVRDGFGSADEYQALMERSEPWMAGLPVRAEADECRRYRK